MIFNAAEILLQVHSSPARVETKRSHLDWTQAKSQQDLSWLEGQFFDVMMDSQIKNFWVWVLELSCRSEDAISHFRYRITLFFFVFYFCHLQILLLLYLWHLLMDSESYLLTQVAIRWPTQYSWADLGKYSLSSLYPRANQSTVCPDLVLV